MAEEESRDLRVLIANEKRDRLRTATNGRSRKPTSARGGLQLPQRLEAPARTRSR